MKLFFSIVIASVFLLSPSLSKVREDYKNAVNDSTKVENLYNELEEVSKEDGIVLLAYKGAVSTLMAKFAGSTKEKKNFFKEGASLIEFAVEEDPENIEIRYIRLGVQENAPKVTKYRKNISEDKQFILDHYKEILSSKVKEYIKGFVMQSKLFSETEKELIN